MKVGKSVIAGIALGLVVLGGGVGVTSASESPRPGITRSMAREAGPMASLASLDSFTYTLELKATGAEARYTAEDYEYLGVQSGDQFAMTVRGIVAGQSAQSTVTVGTAREVNWRNGDRYEWRANSDPIDRWEGPFAPGDFDDTSLYAAQQYWDETLLSWFEANRAGFVCSAGALPLGMEVRECAYDGRDETALYDLLDAVSYGSFDEFTRLDVKATFIAGTNAPIVVNIVAVGADEMGGDTSFELSLKLGDINNASLRLPAAPSGS